MPHAPWPSVPPATGAGRMAASGFEWERWLGVRGAAVLGGVVVAIAGLLFLKYSVEQGWFTPRMRVLSAAIGGVLALLGSWPLRARGYAITADAVAGAGAVVLYGAAWAAHVLYGFVGFELAFACMVATTVACLALAARHASLVIAVLGLVGGFATPLVLASGADRPVALFTYVLFLDLAFLFQAGKRRWPSLGLVALGGTFLVQGLWLVRRGTPETFLFALGVLAVFALVFALFVARLANDERKRWVPAQVGAVLLPFVWGLYVAHQPSIGLQLAPTMGLAVLLTVAAAWVARTGATAWLPLGSASGSVALAFTWAVSREDELGRRHLLELAVCAGALLAVNLASSEWAQRRVARGRTTADVASGARDASLVAALGFLLLTAWIASRPIEAGPRTLVLLGVGAVVVAFRAVARGAHASGALAAVVLLGAQLVAWSLAHARGPFEPRAWTWSASVVGVGAVVLAASWLVRRTTPAWLAAASFAWAVLAVLAAIGLGPLAYSAGRPWFVPAGFVLTLQVALAATIVARSAWGSALFTCAAVLAWLVAGSGYDAYGHANAPRFVALFAANLALVVAFTAWPLARHALWSGRTQVWRVAALVPFAWTVHLYPMVVERWGESATWTMPTGLALVAARCAWRANAVRGDEDRARRVGRVAYAACAILLVALVVPLQVGHDELVVGLALAAPGWALLWRRWPRPALPWGAAGALVVATIVACGWRAWHAFPHADVRGWNVLAWIYLVPVAAAVATAILLRRAPRDEPAARPLVVAPGIAGGCAVVLGFAWINLEIANAFADATEFTWRFEHDPARGLTVSIAWAAYALALLVVGVWARRSGPRWASLALILLTIAKVFLSDLGHLTGLYRAASVLGLGVSLLVVSVLYQRFVFRRAKPEGA